MMEDQIISRLVTKGPTPSPPPALSDEFITNRNPTRHKTDRLQPTHPRFVTIIIRFIPVILCQLIPLLRSEPHLDSPYPS